MSAYVIEARLGLDPGHERVVSGTIGPFDSHAEAQGWVDSLGPTWGSYSIFSLTTPWSPWRERTPA